jgi:hypothetical protein
VDFIQSAPADLFIYFTQIKKEKDADLNPFISGIFP